MRLATREAHKILNWPEMDADMARKARKAFFRAYDVYHMMKPMTTDQIARAYDDLMHSMYEAYQTHGNPKPTPTAAVLRRSLDGRTSSPCSNTPRNKGHILDFDIIVKSVTDPSTFISHRTNNPRRRIV
ncbi:protein kinase domain-containing protein [Pseudozyma hubeiensis SY62]|uniref:Protein kinase domain-containing protein n=1 Tax=Pseudozyma hubeiensis (strain SY62) TaxID=1305764 RepID=R9PGC8_PSEHS|nr:protein kinase domain-containing protein [Pseudozyma hubeiensis SY62]GAC97165.1 protein kinase domain-containing protein [Pseudozyma hubeiensis SY62]